ncbi:YcaO-like family protein [Paenibacillus caui]|uniref:YcaO-like family protein n=1 Tax=Paenibacillus caui TaxID=2873927 RepID=UPI001CA81E0D|nr:YcaO-like family protein [Paenibacillus caui]
MALNLYGHCCRAIIKDVFQEDFDTEGIKEAEAYIIYSRMPSQFIMTDQSSKDHSSAYATFFHRNILDIKRHLLYFLLNRNRYRQITITTTEIQFLIQYEQMHTLKESLHDKRVKSEIYFEELEHILMFYHGGYVQEHRQGEAVITNRRRFEIQGFGFGLDFKDASRKALFEYLERFAASFKLQGTICASYEEVRSRAVDPASFGLYDAPKPPIVQYSPTIQMEWVNACSLQSGINRLVPEQMSQYLKEDILNRFVYESSNGCAIGNSYVEAILYSLYEAMERDLFMKCWFYGSPLKEIKFDIELSPPMEAVEMYFDELGYNIKFYYLENKMNICAVWCLITNQTNNGFYSITGLGCHLHIEHAVQAAFFEAHRSFIYYCNKKKEDLEKEIKLAEQLQEIRNVIDHMHYFLSLTSKPLIEKRIQNTDVIIISKLLGLSFRSVDLKNELNEVVNRSKKEYDDLLIVDQTNPFLKSFSLFCTKALLLGAVPLDFTSSYIRPYHQLNDAKMKERNIHPLA